MANDIVPEPQPGTEGTWDKVIEAVGNFNLPKLIAGPAGEAIARLIAGGADIPAAWLQQKAQAIKDKTESQSLVTKTLAGAAAELVKNDPALVKRAAEAFIAKEIGHQHNRETVAVKALGHLKETPDAQTTKPDDDWLNLFARHAQEASSERMQDLWGKILAGQLRTANAFSLQTLRFASELDETTASLFEKWSAFIQSAMFLPFPPQDGPSFSELIQLEDFGLLTGVVSQISNQIKDQDVVEHSGIAQLVFFNFRLYRVYLRVKKPFNFNYRCAVLTRIGRELYPITKAPATISIVQKFADECSKNNVLEIGAFNTAYPIQTPIVLWTDPSPQP
jgi:Protein of unknown function (DUF2806)